MESIRGYLVVLRDPGCPHRLGYRGIFRAPTYPSDLPEEQEAMDKYVFSTDIRSPETWMIAGLAKARELLSLFARSPRKYEIIYCESTEAERGAGELPACTNQSGQFLGFDVAPIGGEFWSILDDMPAELKTYASDLNPNGLFDKQSSAEEYLDKYRRMELPDYDMPFMIWRVYAVP